MCELGDNISKKLEQKADTQCIHTITQEDNNSVLSLAANDKYIFSGSQGSKIHVRFNKIRVSQNKETNET